MKYTWLYFVTGAVLTWGAYVVTIDHGRSDLAGIKQAGKPLIPPAIAAMRAFLFIGIAYFVIGVVVPAIYLWANPVPAAQKAQDPGFFARGVTISTIAGILGAAGALCIVFAVGFARQANVSPSAVASLVFCFAPIVNVIVSMIIEPPASAPSPWFFLGIILAAVGAGLVLYNKPEPKPHGPAGGGHAKVHVAPAARGFDVIPVSNNADANASQRVVTIASEPRKMHYPPPVIDWNHVVTRVTEEFDVMWDRAMRGRFDKHQNG